MDEKLKRRKLDALKRGVHRVGSDEILSTSSHVVGIGKAGVGVITELLRDQEPGAPRITALAVDIGDQDMAGLRELSASIPAERAEITMVALEVPQRDDLLDALRQYREFLTLEYPRYSWAANYRPWLTPSVELPAAGHHFERAVAKAIYGQAYYSGQRPLQRALRAFASGVDATKSQAVVAIVFGLGGGTGSGIAVDLARHLSNGIFGRRVLVAGVGIMPCDGDRPEHAGGNLFAVLNELDCLGDDEKNAGVIRSCGDMYKNPFTAGFIMIPQQHVWESTQDLDETNLRTDREIAGLVAARGGANLWEMLRLLNWVAAPSTQHSAARTPYGAKWIHMLGFTDMAGRPIAMDPKLRGHFGLLPSYRPEYIEMRVQDVADERTAASADGLEKTFAPDVPPQVVGGGRPGSVQFILPCISKTDIRLFYETRALYDTQRQEQKLLAHSLLLDQGVLLSEPSTRLEGMAGASLWGSDAWIAVPLADLRGERAPAEPVGLATAL